MEGSQVPGTRLRNGAVNLAAVAEAAGVSKMTASRVLRNATGFSEETRLRVLQEVDRLGYVPNRIAAAFGSDQTSTIIGVCVPHLTSVLFGSVLDSVDHTLSGFGYQTMIGTHAQSPQAEEIWLRNILAWRPGGLILTYRNHSPSAIELIKAQGVPVVEMGDPNIRPLDISVGANHFESGFEMGRHIVDRGHRRIAYVGGEANAPGTGSIRFNGFNAALQSAGATLVAKEILVDQPGFKSGLNGTQSILNRVESVDAIYYQEDTMAIGGLFLCKSRGLTVPTDIGIAGWGGMEAASVLPGNLTTTFVDTQSIGKTAAEALMARISGEPFCAVTVVPTQLVPGSTT